MGVEQLHGRNVPRHKMFPQRLYPRLSFPDISHLHFYNSSVKDIRPCPPSRFSLRSWPLMPASSAVSLSLLFLALSSFSKVSSLHHLSRLNDRSRGTDALFGHRQRRTGRFLTLSNGGPSSSLIRTTCPTTLLCTLFSYDLYSFSR